MNNRDDLKKIYTAAINAVNPKTAIDTHIKLDGDRLVLFSDDKPEKEYDLNKFNRIFVVGAGKATASMAGAIEILLGDRITGGCISVKYGYTENLLKIETVEASHPIPDSNGVNGAKKIREILNQACDDDLVISLISGGGSSLLPLPPDSITLKEKQETTDLLLKSGAAIHEINAIRKHLSLVKGGNMARAAYPAEVINLMISDVVGDNMDVIASGPFVPDNSSFSMAMEIIEKYELENRIPVSVKAYIKSGIDKKIEENPDEDSSFFKNITNLVIASNIIALKAAKETAEKIGYNSIILSSLIEGDTKAAALWHSRIAKEVLASSNPVEIPVCIISGGETTVVVQGNGLGGRNMEFAIQAANFITGLENVIMASIGTDGTDGPTDAAGAIAHGFTVKNAMAKGIEIDKYIENNDSYHFFEKLEDLIITGPTNTNVMDVRIILITM